MEPENQQPKPAEASKTLLSDAEQELALMVLSLQKWGVNVAGKSPDEVRQLFAEHRKLPPVNNMQTEKAAADLEARAQRAAKVREKRETEAQRNGAHVQRVHAERFYRESEVPKRHNLNLSDIDANPKWLEVRDRLASEEVQGDGYLVALLGDRGTGKTQLAVSVIFGTCERLKRCRYIKAMDLFRLIRSTFSRSDKSEPVTTESSIIDTLTSYDLLVIDEFHQRAETDFEQNTLINLLDKRYDACKCTIVVANQSKNEFGAAVGDSVISRIYETGDAIVCDWPSYRKPGTWRN